LVAEAGIGGELGYRRAVARARRSLKRLILSLLTAA
jgi:hypothetical protein